MDFNSLFNQYLSKIKPTAQAAFNTASKYVTEAVRPVFSSGQKDLPSFQSATNKVTSMANNNPLTNALSQAKNAVAEVIENPSPYATSLKYAVREKVLPHYSFQSWKRDLEAPDVLDVKGNVIQQGTYSKTPFLERSFKFMDRNNLSVAPEGEFVPPSARLRPFFELPSTSPTVNPITKEQIPPEATSMYDKERQAIMGNFSEAYQKYLSAIPITSLENPNAAANAPGSYANMYSDVSNQAPDYTFAPRSVNINPSLPARIASLPTNQIVAEKKRILAHEFLHQAPRNFFSKSDFVDNIYGILQRNPDLYKIAMSYNGKSLPNPEEIFAQIGMAVGPNIVNHPEIGKYYKKIFKQPTAK